MVLEDIGLTEEQLAAVQKYTQSETDKVRTKYSAELKTAQDELEKYKPKEKSPENIELEQRIQALEARERELTQKEKTMELGEKLKKRGLPTELSAFLNVGGEDEDATLDKIGEFFLSQSNKPGSHTRSSGVSIEDFRKMSYNEKAKLYNEDPDLYNSLATLNSRKG